MDIPMKIKLASTYSKISITKLAEETMGVTRAALHARLKTGKFSTEELNQIAEAMGAKFEFHFVFPDGVKI